METKLHETMFDFISDLVGSELTPTLSHAPYGGIQCEWKDKEDKTVFVTDRIDNSIYLVMNIEYYTILSTLFCLDKIQTGHVVRDWFMKKYKCNLGPAFYTGLLSTPFNF